MSGDNGGDPGQSPAAVEEAAMIQQIARALAMRFKLDLADGKLLERPILMLVFMCENLLDRVELLEEINEIKQKEPSGGLLIQPD